MPYDLFISYSRSDNVQGRITQLVARIQQDFAAFAGRELVPFFDHHEINGMEDWRQRILQGLRESRLLLACLSPAYLQSGYCEWEFVEYLKYEIGHLHGFNGVAPIYFVEVPGWTDKNFDQRCAAWIAELRRRQHFDLRPWHDQGEDALREADVRERLTKLNRQIADTILRGERAEKSLGNVDAHNPHFIGRTANLRMLRENFVTPGHIGVVTAVNGVGGLGKTALAIEYAHAFADEYGGGRWQVRCAGKDDLRLALAELATSIGFEFTDDEKKNAGLQFERTRRELKKLADARAPHRCLLLLDNVDRPGLLDPAQVARLNGGDWLHVLATTRLGENELHGAHRDRSFLAIDELPPDDALALIESYQPDERFRSEAERDAAREIVRLLGSFTLAVESAAVYLGQFANDVTCAGFLARLKKEGLEGLDAAASQSDVGVRHGEKRLSATLQPTLERLGAAEKLALEFAALLPPDQVPLPWLRALVAMLIPEMACDSEPGHPDPWKNLIRQLLDLRLFQATSIVDAYGQVLVLRIHRLLQGIVLRNMHTRGRSIVARVAHWLVQNLMLREMHNLRLADLSCFLLWFVRDRILRGSSGGDRAWLQRLIIGLAEQRASRLEGVTDWIESRWELEPFSTFAGLCDQSNHPKAASLLRCAAKCWYRIAEWSRAELLLRRALAIDEQRVGIMHSEVARDLNDLAVLLQDTNRLADAEPLMRRALAIDEGRFGSKHSRLTVRLINLAALLQATNRQSQAEPLLHRALNIDEQCFGLSHPNVARDLNNLAGLLHATNRLAEAEPLLRRALAINERCLGSIHPDVAKCLGNLGGLLHDTDRTKEAEPLVRRALTIFEQCFGAEHPAVAHSLNNLAMLLQDTNRSAEVEPLLRRALAIQEASLGTAHPSVATILNNLSLQLYMTNRLAEAEPLLRRSLEITFQFKATTGHEHPEQSKGVQNFKRLLSRMGRSPAEVQAELNAVARPYGIQFGSNEG